MSTQNEVYARWARDPEGFWAEAGEAIHWYKRWDRVLDGTRAPFYRWFAGATINTCENALDWHVEHGRADQPALIYDSPVTSTIQTPVAAFRLAVVVQRVCRRRAPGRFCAARSRRSPMAWSTACRPRSTILRVSRRSRRCWRASGIRGVECCYRSR